MAGKYRLLAGMHIGPDLTAEQVEVRDHSGEVVKDRNGKVVTKYPSRIYRAGDVVVSKDDLSNRFGHQKFERLGADFAIQPAASYTPNGPDATNPTAPHDQVSTGWPTALPGDATKLSEDRDEEAKPQASNGPQSGHAVKSGKK